MKTKNLFLLCLLGMMGIGVSAYDFEVDGIYYNIISSDNLTCSVTSSNHAYSGEVNIPSTVTYNGKTYSVTTIGSFAFYSDSGLISVIIPNSVTTIERCAFYCSSLTSVTIPNSVTTIGEHAFWRCI